MQGKGEALLQFIINKHDINLDLGRNREELQQMQAALGPVLRDSLATVNQLTIYGMASADGSLNFNTGLAARRAASAKKWLMDQLAISPRLAQKFKVGSRPEGWEPVLEAMRKDGHPDSLKVQEILERFAGQSDDKAEYYIRRLACWNDIKNNYLQKDRKVVYEYSYTLKSFTTNEELLEMYTKRPDAFNEEELLKVASLKEEPEEKEAVYRTTLHYYPQSVTAAHNLAALLLRKGAYAEAEKVLELLPAEQLELRNLRAVLALVHGDYHAAIAGWEADTINADTRYNLGLAYALLHRFDDAYRWLQEFEDTNAALVSLCAEQTDRAQAQITACTDPSPKAAYVRALVAARRNDKAEVLAQLHKAAAEPQWLNRAAGEVEFRAYWKDADFIALVKGGTAL
ncbi:hypothetical protein EVA_07641 [gut metagenome]|uniref:Tetratricopeptide repeat protein n=1 Tax=gut metagenome TaxID=749906 RepID=J9GAD6_9ZZZZ